MRRLILLLLVPAVLLAAVGVVNWRVDPFGWFYGEGPLQAAHAEPGCLVGNDAIGGVSYQAFKLDVLRGRPGTTTAVVGSSRVLKIAPRDDEAAFSNLGHPGTSPRALVRQLRDVGDAHPGPLTLYVGVEFMWLNPTWSFAVEFHPSVMRRLGYVLGRSALTDSVDLARSIGLRDALRGWERRRVNGTCVISRGIPTIAWTTAGVRMYAFEIDPRLARPTPSPWTGQLTDFRAGQYAGYTHIDEDALDELRKALDIARERGWRVVGFAPPDSTRYARLIATHPETRDSWRAFTERVPALFTERGFGWLDIHDVRDVPCAQDAFVDDGWHVDAACAARIRDRLDAAAAALPSPRGAGG